MFDISFGELLLIAVVAVVFIKPEDVPQVMRVVAKAMRWVKQTSKEIISLFDEATTDIKKTTMIKGDDGQYYQAYDVATLDVMTLKKPEEAADGK